MADFVITGGPGCGKTTLCDRLLSAELTVVPEAARFLIEQEGPSGITPERDLLAFQFLVLGRQLAQEQHCQGSPRVLDRGRPDLIAYCLEGGFDPPQEILDACRRRYDAVFLLDPLPEYRNDTVRLEDRAKALRLHLRIEEAYRSLGYEPIRVPLFSPFCEKSLRARASFILDHIGGAYGTDSGMAANAQGFRAAVPP